MTLGRAATWRVPLVFTVLAALFWGAWWLVAGAVPSVSSIPMGGWEITLPLAVSRLWDIPAAAVMALLVVLTKNLVDRDDFPGVFFGVVMTVAIFVGLLSGLALGLPVGLAIAAAVFLGFGLLLILGLLAVTALNHLDWRLGLKPRLKEAHVVKAINKALGWLTGN